MATDHTDFAAVSTLTSPGREPAAVTLDELLDELDSCGWLSQPGISCCYHLRGDGTAVLTTHEGDMSLAEVDAYGLIVDGFRCDSLVEALRMLGEDAAAAAA